MMLGAEALLGPSNGAGQGKAGGVQKGCIQAVPEQQKQQLIKQLDWSKLSTFYKCPNTDKIIIDLS